MNTDCDRRMQIELRDKIDLKKRNSELEAENAQLQARLHEVSEIYAGAEGFKPKTAPEAYCLRVMEQMYQAALTEGEKT